MLGMCPRSTACNVYAMPAGLRTERGLSVRCRSPRGRLRALLAAAGGVLLLAPLSAVAAPGHGHGAGELLFMLPSLDDVLRVASLQDYNTRLVVLSTALLGLGCGLIGSFLLLRKRSLMSDALSHATLPGIAIAFMVMVALGGTGKSLAGLQLGAAITGVIGFLSVLAIRRLTPVKEDTAMGIVLSVYFGAGIALLGIVQSMPSGSAAGLESFIYGKTASMVMADFQVIAGMSLLVVIISLLFFKELRLICFDEGFARAQGWPVRLLDGGILLLVTAVTVAGLQSVGLILIIAFLITPAVTARLWTHRFSRMLLIAGLVGAASGWIGASLSALMPRLPAGAVIVLTTSFLFVISLFIGPKHGLIAQAMRLHRLRVGTSRQHLLRAAYELLEQQSGAGGIPAGARSVRFHELLAKRSWTEGTLRSILGRAYRDALVERPQAALDTVTLTERGLREATRITRNHRMWELYLILHADIAPAQVDRDADAIEHILSPEIIQELETELAASLALRPGKVPQSPHPIR